ncbi:hypothetical protein chiPu_0033788 [Chiloscyllium punctatum]|uniref:Uncharacterized protein n=1 Tax=Chiloscyllium punctatum TaxID=137246 RepID=A0A401U4H2_CHIPU|nr:hypothetical protein [Chiloscyllium punctatum]
MERNGDSGRTEWERASENELGGSETLLQRQIERRDIESVGEERLEGERKKVDVAEILGVEDKSGWAEMSEGERVCVRGERGSRSGSVGVEKMGYGRED